jgi:hypothetical protein
VGLETNLLFDDVGAKVFPVELLGRVLSMNIRREKSNFNPNDEFDMFVLSVIMSRLSVSGGFDSFNKGIVVSLEVFSVFLGHGILGIWVDTKVNAELGMITVGGKEWRIFD